MRMSGITQAVVVVGFGVVLAGNAPSAQTKVAPPAPWASNGATACEKFVTVDVMSAVLIKPSSGAPSKDGAKACHRGSIYVALSTGSVDAFKKNMDHVALATPMSGVGDAAYWTPAGAVSAVKAPDRQCDISVADVLPAMRLKDEALGQALGAVCTQLFALK
jgi:hypothetical protein